MRAMSWASCCTTAPVRCRRPWRRQPVRGRRGLALAVAAVTPTGPLIWTVTGASIACLAALGRWPPAPAARGPAALRVTILGALAMAVTAGVGAVFGVAV